MKTPDPTKAESSAPDSANPSRVETTKAKRINWNERQRRVLVALWSGPRMREELDRLAPASNAPHLIYELRCKGIEIVCERVLKIDRDGKRCRPGRYILTARGRRTLRELGWGNG